MEIKNKDQPKSYLDIFDIADSSGKETNLSKILAYLISKDERALRSFLNLLDIKLEKKHSKTLLKNASVLIENSYTKNELNTEARKGGRTDIEIKIENPDIFIIVECKVNNNKATLKQYELYKPIYRMQKKVIEGHDKYFVYLSHQSGINIVDDNNNINVIDITWRDVINVFSNISDSSEQTELQAFINYYERRYGMSNQKEILVQDLSDQNEVERLQNCVYKRGKVNGSPLYFAPYFTRSHEGEKEGITQFSKILGIITTNDINWEKIYKNCNRFLEIAYPYISVKDEKIKEITDEQKLKSIVAKIDLQAKGYRRVNKEKDEFKKKENYYEYDKQLNNIQKEKARKKLIKLWGNGIKEIQQIKDSVFTYYFLEFPINLSFPLKKDNGIEKGRGKNWIAGAIPQNRCVSFADFIEHSILAQSFKDKKND